MDLVTDRNNPDFWQLLMRAALKCAAWQVGTALKRL
jgi:hypothetical protein